MKPGAIVGAILGGILGALAWGAIAKFLDMELGYVAWGVGIAVGFLSAAFGGKGFSNGVMCAIVALIAIFGGKVLAVKWSATPETLMSELAKEPEFAKLNEEEKLKAATAISGAVGWSEAVDIAKENLDFIDILFAIFGIGTAFRLGGAPKEETTYRATVPPTVDVKPAGPAPDVPSSAPPMEPHPSEPKQPDT